jgi:hypothetical protein
MLLLPRIQLNPRNYLFKNTLRIRFTHNYTHPIKITDIYSHLVEDQTVKDALDTSTILLVRHNSEKDIWLLTVSNKELFDKLSFLISDKVITINQMPVIEDASTS